MSTNQTQKTDPNLHIIEITQEPGMPSQFLCIHMRDGDHDPIEAITAASIEYVTSTHKNWTEYQEHMHERFRITDFLNYVPNDIRERHGILSVKTNVPALKIYVRNNLVDSDKIELPDDAVQQYAAWAANIAAKDPDAFVDMFGISPCEIMTSYMQSRQNGGNTPNKTD